jgi:hypothetical protein
MENFNPLFKERDTDEGKEQLIYKKGKWKFCSEEIINSLWILWVSSIEASSYYDNEGYLVFGYKLKEKNPTICYKFLEEIDMLKLRLIIGKEYLFSDMLQEEKQFKVEWEKGILDKIERHPNSANCFVSGIRYYLYAKEI